jgi:hypothetical protein
MKIRTTYLTLSLSALLATFSSSLLAQVHYDGDQPWKQRADSGPDAEVPGWYYNLGLTGIRAELAENEPKALLVKHVFKKSPAKNAVKIDDQIIGVGGKKFRKPHRNGYGMEVFGAEGPVAELAEALEACQATSATGKLKLMVKRGDETMEVELDIGKKYGSYAATYPSACPKSDKILEELLDYITKNQDENGSFGDPVHNTFAALALLGSGEKKYLPDVERNLRHLCASIKSTDEGARKDGLMNWTYMGTGIVLCEYYLITKKSWVLPELEKIRDLLYEGQYLDMSQINPKVKESHPDSYPTSPKQAHGGWGHNPGFEGYGPIAMITAQGALTFALMHQCGIEIDSKRHEAAYDFLKRGTGQNGYVGYGDSASGPDEWADMGRTGAAGIACFLAPKSNVSYRRLSQKHSDVIGKHPQSFPDTHASPIMGMGYEALGANIDPKNFRKLMDANRWWFTMAQCGDETFYYQPNRDSSGYDSSARMSASCVVAFIYTMPKRNLLITGKAIK